MTKQICLAVWMVIVGMVAGGCDQLTKATSPSGATSSANATGTAVLVGLWASQSTGAVANLSSCSNFQWNVTSQAGNAIGGTFSAVCLGAYQLTGTATGQLNAGIVHIVLNASANLPSVGACPVSLTADGSLDGDLIRLPYVAQTCLGNYSGTETLKKSLFVKSPTPAPEPTPDPTPTPAPNPIPTPVPPADEIDLNQVTVVLGPRNIASWPQTATVTSAKAAPNELCVFTTKTGLWPTALFFDTDAPIEGNQWVFANIGGRWYGGAGEWQRPGQACKPVNLWTMGSDTFYADNMEPLRSWVPQPGEVFGVMASTPARAWPSMRTIDERSNVVLVRAGQ